MPFDFPPPDCWRPLSCATLDSKRMLTIELPPAEPANAGSVQDPILAIRPVQSLGEVLAVTYGITLLEGQPSDGEYVFIPRGRLKWGLGGVNFEAEYDLLNGVQVAVVAETLEATVFLDEYTPPWDECQCVPCAPRFRVQAGVGYGVTGRNARYTMPIFLEPYGSKRDSEVKQIPPFAQDVAVQVFGDDELGVRMLGFGRGLAKDYVFEGGPSPLNFGLGRTIPIAGGQQFVEVFNTSPNRVRANLVFRLAL